MIHIYTYIYIYIVLCAVYQTPSTRCYILYTDYCKLLS